MRHQIYLSHVQAVDFHSKLFLAKNRPLSINLQWIWTFKGNFQVTAHYLAVLYFFFVQQRMFTALAFETDDHKLYVIMTKQIWNRRVPVCLRQQATWSRQAVARGTFGLIPHSHAIVAWPELHCRWSYSIRLQDKRPHGQKATGQKATATHLRVFYPAHKCNMLTSLPGPCFFHGLHTHTTRVVLEHKRENRRQCCV